MSSEDDPTVETSTGNDADGGTSGDGGTTGDESIRIDGDGTVHTRSAGTTGDGERPSTATEGSEATMETDSFGAAGWLLVAAVVVCFVLIPGLIYVYPYLLASFGLSFFGTYLMLPLVPAALLGLVAVWSMTAAA